MKTALIGWRGGDSRRAKRNSMNLEQKDNQMPIKDFSIYFWKKG